MKYRHKLISLILDFLFPRAAPIVSIQNMSASELDQKIPKAREIDGKELYALFDYRDELAKQAIWEIKYRKNEKLVSSFCKIFYEYMLDEIADEAIFSDFKNPILVPVPSSKSRLRERGYNQCELIAEELMRVDDGKNFALRLDALEKIKDLPSQTSLKNRNERLSNLKGCFEVGNPDKISGTNIILIDDVITTGATMSEAKKILLNAGARQVLCFALAH
ncbi:MAG: Phosphoribosyltransferase [Parcubacteria group bacterium]|nr:Phosphoribosyltransferase [Parcubacteria group bacterium]